MNYYKIISGAKSVHAEKCYEQKFIGIDFGIREDLTAYKRLEYQPFSEVFIPLFLQANPGKNKIAAGLACGAAWLVVGGIEMGDIVLSPNGHGQFMVGKITSDYFYAPHLILPHCRKVSWEQYTIVRSTLSDELRAATKFSGAISQVTAYGSEIDAVISGWSPLDANTEHEAEESSATFALEKHLEEFLIENWSQTELGKIYSIYEEDGEIVGQQFPSDTGPIDILAVSKDKKSLLVVELKRGRASDKVVGQIQRYMGYVKDQLAEPDQVVRGAIIALQDDLRIRRALSVTTNIEFYTYEVSFKLKKSQ